ncbi:MAG: phosphotransferase [Eubacterium sp.]|nr:phosphotransferase [Eubacterium sp.]
MKEQFKSKIMNKVFDNTGDCQDYYMIDNGYKVWVLPQKHMKEGFNVYQVSNWRGFSVKNVFPLVARSRFARKVFKAQVYSSGLSRELQEIIGLYDEAPYQISMYFGNLDAKQNYKATLQIYHPQGKSWYLKLSDERIVQDAFENEIENLAYLKEQNLFDIPQKTSLETRGEWSYLILDSVPYGKTKYSFTEQHWDNLQKIYEKTKVKIDYEESDFKKCIDYLKEQFSRNPYWEKKEEFQKIVLDTEQWMRDHLEHYSFAHGDYTPWNIYWDAQGVRLFDFEYSMKQTIPFLDYFHFICQSDIIRHHMDWKRTLKLYEKERGRLMKYSENPDKLFIGYLLYIIAFYLKRKDGEVPSKNGQLKYRLKLVEELWRR